ncbi:MAG: cation:proton antiporter [Bacteroidales bacterium]|jgi:Trk K+ transport system NAD-binding subunit/Kef-type K+ transport system membrane component KefB|nr:cation:proton antiporter [Bacteroidales bacterium]
MEEYKQLFIYVLGFVWILFASEHFAKFFKKTRLPLITGFLITGIVTGPHVLNLIEIEALHSLGFINDIALAFIAFAAGAQLYLKEIRSRAKSITWNTIGQFALTFTIGTVGVFLLADHIPFMHQMETGSKIAVALLAASIFIASSPSSAIAVISEMRAKGPFTQTAMGVTVIKDVLVIALFAICLSLAVTVMSDTAFNISFILILLLELGLAFGIGYLVGKLISYILSFTRRNVLKTILILGIGYGIFIFSHFMHEWSSLALHTEIHIEPLLIAIVASFSVTNYSKYRAEFRKILDDTGPPVYVAFFTLVGAMLSIDILAKVWLIALLLFFVRLVAIIVGTYIGTVLAGDPPSHKRLAWMSYVTQAGVGLGLTTEVAGEFSEWGAEFATIIIAVIVLNQVLGPPLFKWAINKVGEAHLRGETPAFDGVRDVIIFGLEDQSLALARQLQKHDWKVKIATFNKKEDMQAITDVQLEYIKGLELEDIEVLEAKKAEAIVLMLSDEENIKIAELCYEEMGTKDIIVRLNNRKHYNHFQELGALIVEPYSAVVGLLDHFVRAPIATSLILGMDEKQDSEDFEVLDKQLHGVAIRDLKLPPDILILSVKRKGHMVVTHGYTRLRKKDIVTALGSIESLEQLRLLFEK